MNSVKPLIDPDGARLPIKLDTTSNGEFEPVPLSPVNHAANASHMKRLIKMQSVWLFPEEIFLSPLAARPPRYLPSMPRTRQPARQAASSICRPKPRSSPSSRRRKSAAKGEFIFDVQGHFVDPNGAWVQKLPPGSKPLSQMPKTGCALALGAGSAQLPALPGPEEFIKDVFLDSDTDMMVLSFVPSKPDAEPLTIQAADAVRRIVDRMEGMHRLLLHGRVNPNQADDLEAMDELKERWSVSAWKTYTQFGPGGKGYFLSDDIGTRFIEKARKLDVKVICVHKGLPFGKQSYEHSQCSDIGVVAKRFPDVAFLIYHSGFVTTRSRTRLRGQGRG